MARKTKILLDRNVISLIKTCNKEGFSELSTHKRKQHQKIKRLDKKNTIVSALLSVCEGEKGRYQFPNEIKNVLRKETQELDSFFYSAETDNSFLIEGESSLLNFIMEGYNKRRVWEELLETLNQHMYEPCGAKKQNDLYEKIINFCKKSGQSCHHLVPMICISALFGYEDSQRVLKFKKNKFNAYNALNDIFMLQTFIYARDKSRKMVEKKQKLDFFTFDKALKSLNRILNASCTIENNNQKSDTVTFKTSPKKDIFPKMSDKKYNDYINLK